MPGWFRVDPHKHPNFVCARASSMDIELEDALPEAHAPVDEPATSADELGEDDEAVCLLSLSPLQPGAWVVLHGLVGKPELNGRVARRAGQPFA